MSDSTAAVPPSATRNLRPASVVPGLAAHANRWAIVVGISKYEHERLNLKYAHRDAEELYKLLQTPSGGGFEPDRMVKLIDDKATTAGITRALRSFLKKPAREDVVLLYFACHGSPDLDRPNIVYLLTHDTDPDDISGTALPMREIDLSLRENLLAEKVVIIADTCHSASIGGGVGRRGSGNDAGAINAYLEQLSVANGGLALLTSAEASETAQEGQQWGDGHGVFTYYLLKGLRGEADGYGSPKDGVVGVGELFDYVRDNVKRATNDQQHAAIGTAAFDRSLPMAITGGVDARAHYELGTGLLDLGWRLDDRERFLAAAQQFSEAIRLSRMARSKMPEAEVGLGEALLAAGEAEHAVEVLEAAVRSGAAGTTPHGFLLLGVARATLDADTPARKACEEYLNLDPEGAWAAWARLFLRRPERGPRRTLALLIGINQYRWSDLPALTGCVNDTRLVSDAIIQRAGVSEGDIAVLLDDQATKEGIVAAFTAMAARAGPSDSVIVHFSGHSVPDNAEMGGGFNPDDIYLIASDSVDGSTGISPEELHRMMKGIPSQHKTLVLDTHPRSAFNDLAATEGDYWVLLASDSAQLAYENSFVLEGLLVPAGLFTGAITEELRQADVSTLTFGNLLDGAMVRMRERGFPQVPVLIGDRGDLVFGDSDVFAWAAQFASRRTFVSETVDTLRSRHRRTPADLLTALPALELSFGRAYIEHGAHDEAVAALERAVAADGPHRPEARRLLASAQVTLGRLGDANSTLTELTQDIEPPERAETLRVSGRRLANPRRRAVLVGIDRYQSPECQGGRGAVNDVRLMKECLVTCCGFRAKDVTVLTDKAATRDAILSAFRRLSERSDEGPTLFFFAGIGSKDAEGNPTLVSSDGRADQIYDVGLPELVHLTNEDSNVVTILDAGFLRATDFPPGSRTTASDTRERPAGRGIGPAVADESRGRPPNTAAKIGLLTIYNLAALEMNDAQTSAVPLEGTCAEVLSDGRQVHGYLTHGLVRTLAGGRPEMRSYRDWVTGTQDSEPPVQCAVVGEGVDEPVFQDRAARNDILTTLSSMDTAPVGNVVDLLRRLIAQREEQNDHDPHARLNLGVAYAAMGECTKAIDSLGRAISLYNDQTIMARERQRDPRADDHLRDAHYQLGRIIYDCGIDFTKATSELNEAVRQDPTNARAHYYLGQSIRSMVENETLAKAVEALRTYLTLGAPLGHENEVREFLGSRKKATTENATMTR